ncbi:class I SAM-dependent methyltransferase [Nitrolancea hollandica]|uniref:Putative Methyltransferase type 11 n=1 Tax=Nitrolancea hollandica Lb TaxID=1129897 RepID=I4EG69_9BACT|nr:class I SAM-dependent methyltransferase [Nitrolancea hollandica]CCF83681.1 putative Methyltransferase type 11 [Nitrolancea hollandica Lb]
MDQFNPLGHKGAIQREFTRQAAAFAANPVINDRDRVTRLVEAVNPGPEANVLDVACGPGYVAIGFAGVCREVVGIDITSEMLAIAERNRRARGLSNLRFQPGDADQIPFPDGEFDVVVCRFAFHHFEDPARVLAEMSRVCRVGGTVAVEDLVVSEHPDRAGYQNQFERLRDPSHTRALPVSRFLALFSGSGLEIDDIRMTRITQSVDAWLRNAGTPADRASQVRALIERDARDDLSGTRPFRRDGQWLFVQQSAIILGRKLLVKHV